MASSSATASPGCFSHWPMLASETLSPSVGTLISVGMSVSAFLLAADFGTHGQPQRIGDQRALFGGMALGKAGGR